MCRIYNKISKKYYIPQSEAPCHIGAFYVIIYSSHHPGAMEISYTRKRSISITLDLEVYDDFNYKSIDFSSLLELEGDEHLEVSITDNSDVEVI